MEKYQALAQSIVNYVGGEENVLSLTHCITRLRFKLKDESAAATKEIEALDGVMTVVQSGGQYQVVIGNEVENVYAAILAISNIQGSQTENVEAEDEGKKRSLLDRFIDLVSSIFTPILSVLVATGMIKGFTALLISLQLVAADSGTGRMLGIIGDAFFYFLPIFLGLSAARKFGMSEFTGMATGAALVYPALPAIMGGTPLYTLFADSVFASPVYMEFLGLPVILMNYASSVIPIILALYFGAKIEKTIGRIVPAMLKNFLTPFLTLLILIPLTFLLIGPVATWAGQLVGAAATAIYAFNPLLAGLFIGGFWQVFVIFGLHWGLVPIMINNISVLGYDPVVMAHFAASFAQVGVVLAIILRTQDKKLKALAIPACISGLFGVTEPCIYGVTLPRKKFFILSCIGGAVGGGILTALGARFYLLGGLGIFGYPNFIDVHTQELSGMHTALIASGAAFFTGLALALLAYRRLAADEKPNDEPAAELPLGGLAAPLTGKIVPLTEVPDAVFASECMGKGVAIEPAEGRVIAPAAGTVTTIFPTGHAVGLTLDDGRELLIHVGMDTVQLEGKYFKAHVAQGDKVSAGQLLIEFEPDKIRAAGFKTITPVIITNTGNYQAVTATEENTVSFNDLLLTTI